MDGERPDKGSVPEAHTTAPSTSTGDRTPFPWPWGLVAIGVMALAWVGIYLIWNGVVFLSSL